MQPPASQKASIISPPALGNYPLKSPPKVPLLKPSVGASNSPRKQVVVVDAQSSERLASPCTGAWPPLPSLRLEAADVEQAVGHLGCETLLHLKPPSKGFSYTCCLG